MKYDVMVSIKEKNAVIKYLDNLSCFPRTIEYDDFNPIEWFQKVRESSKLFHTYLDEDIQHKEWQYLKTININEGELRKNDFYEINGSKCSFDIVYNDDTDKVELRVDYAKDIVKHPLYEKVKAKYEEFKKLLDEYNYNISSGLALVHISQSLGILPKRRRVKRKN